MNLTLSEEQAKALQARAAAEGLSLQEWLQQLAEPKQPNHAEHPLQTAADIILSSMRDVPPEIMATMPKDGASQHDHYIYGWPKKEA